LLDISNHAKISAKIRVRQALRMRVEYKTGNVLMQHYTRFTFTKFYVVNVFL